jgi:hypothetical protein
MLDIVAKWAVYDELPAADARSSRPPFPSAR